MVLLVWFAHTSGAASADVAVAPAAASARAAATAAAAGRDRRNVIVLSHSGGAVAAVTLES